jgi:beta-1,4-mannosyl-glycoprotein beta-1,4-N-acetylglucosaminyltransferase
MPKFSIIIPSYKHLSDCLRPCLESVKKHTNLSDVEVIVVLNGCGDDGSREYVESLGAPFRYIWLDEPSGYTHSTNVGIQAAKGGFLFLLNNDVVVLGSHWLDMHYQPFSDPRMGITGPLMLRCPDANREFLVFFAAMIRRQMLDDIGILDEIFAPGYGEDCDLCARAVDAGWKIQKVPADGTPQLIDKGCEDLPEWKRNKMWADGAPLYHDGNKTFGDDPERFDKILERNKTILQERYNKVTCPCDQPEENKKCEHGLYLWRANVIDGWFSTSEGHTLAQWVKGLPEGAKVLEIGSWHCRSSRFIADNLPKNGQLFCCDTWIGSSGEDAMHGSAHQERGDHAHQWWWCNAHEHILEGRVVPIRMHSVNAAHTLAHLKMEFDLIFIDASHDYDSVKEDIESWLPMLKPSGIMCGHDFYPEGEEPFAWMGVRQAVLEKFPEAQKFATSLWYVRPHGHQAELDYQINEGHFDFSSDPKYAEVVKRSQEQIVTKLFTDIPKDSAILDVGCGDGVTLKILRAQGFTNLKGIDISQRDLDTLTDFDVQNCDMHSLPFEDKSLDIVYASHVLEHAYDPIQVLSGFKRVLKDDGKLLLVLPYIEVLDTEHRAKVHCGAETLGLTKADNAETLLKVLSDAGFDNTFREEGTLREEREIYLKFTKDRPYIYDCFIFNDELDILDIRLNTLYDHVDRFVLVEGAKTHSGNPKLLHFEQNLERYSKFLNKIMHVVVDDYPEISDIAGTPLDNNANKAWTRERWQRDAILRGLKDCKDTDIILIGDADEIANPEAIKNYDPSQGLCRLKQRLFYYYLNCENKEGWDWQKIAPYKLVKELTPCGIRYPPAGNTPLIESSGWHFSFLGNAENAIKKIQDYAHVEYANDEMLNRERIEKLISEGRDIFGRDLKYEFVEIDDNYPEHVKQHHSEYILRGLIKATNLYDRRIAEARMICESCGKQVFAGISGIRCLCGHNKGTSYQTLTVTAEISTKDRYHILPAVITAIANQTRKPEKLVIYDDGEQKDLRETPPFDNILKMLDELKIEWIVMKTPREGQVKNHQHCLDTCETDLIFRCFLGHQKVETDHGMVPIRDIKIGDLVKTHLGRFKPVTNVFKTPYKQGSPLLYVKTANSTIKCTPEHPFYVLRNWSKQWVAANQLTTADVLLYPSEYQADSVDFSARMKSRRYGKTDKVVGNVPVDRNVARFMGLYLAEGCGGHDSIRFTFNNKEREYIDFISRMCVTLFDRQPTIHSRWATTVKLNIRSLNERFTNWFGKNAKEKRIPFFVNDWAIDNRLAFINGFLEGDGWRRCNMSVFGIVSREGAQQLVDMCRDSGLDARSLYTIPPRFNEFADTGESYQSAISTQSTFKLLDLLGSRRVDKSYLGIAIVSIESKKMYRNTNPDFQYVFNLEVAEDNSYIVGPAIVHNCDDDCIPTSTCLENLLSEMKDGVGAVAGLIHHPGNVSPLPNFLDGSLRDIQAGLNMQWFSFNGTSQPIETQHLYSSFLFRVRAMRESGGYPRSLSVVGHREESIATHQMYRAGWKLLVTPKAISYHLRETKGGIRSFDDHKLWEHDEIIWQSYLKEWGADNGKPTKVIVADMGRGDHHILKSILPELKERHKDKELILSVCYPDIFADEGLKLISIADAKNMLGERFDEHLLYRFLWMSAWNRPLKEGMLEFWG